MSNKFNLDAALAGAKVKFRDSPMEISQIAYFPERAANGQKPVLAVTTKGRSYWRTIKGLKTDRDTYVTNYDLVMASTTFNLGTEDIPLPESKPLAADVKYYVPAVGGRVRSMIWRDGEMAFQMLRAGRVFLDHKAATQMSEDINRLVNLALEEAHWSCNV